MSQRYIAFDVETPNLSNHRISAIGITVIEDGRIADHYYSLVNPETHFDSFNIQLTGITPEMVKDAPTFPELWKRIVPLMSSGMPVAHNAVFDLGVLRVCLRDYGLFWKKETPYLCTVQMGRKLLPGRSHRLNALCSYYGIALDHHQADSDSNACAEILLRYLESGADPKRYICTFLMAATGMNAAGLLKKIYGYSAFRPGQQQIVDSVLKKKDVLCVMPTGSGKSICYQIPALLFYGTTVVISPLISLMKDQVAALRGRGIAAACLNSGLSRDEYIAVSRNASEGAYRILYVAPERLQAPAFLEMCRGMKVPFVAVDEAHCISQWGQDFRPDYLKIPAFIASMPQRPVVGAFTATATERVRKDILENLQLADPVSVTTGFDRPNLSFSVYEPKNREAKLLELVRDRFRQSGIIYCATRKNVEAVQEMLVREGFAATRYHAGLSREEREKNQEDFLFDRQRIMVATNAFGMGIDKSNVSYVIHFNMPKSLEAYYQEAGRAGRDGCEADCILLYSGQDVIMARWLIEHSEENPDLTQEERNRVREQDEERLKRMTFYARSRRCLRQALLGYFGEAAPDHCGNCSNCVPNCEHQDITVDAQMILSSIARTEQRLPERMVIDLLLGIRPEELPETVIPEKLTTFGIMKDSSGKEIRERIDALCSQGYLDRAADGTDLLKLNDHSREVLFRNRRVAVRMGGGTRETEETPGEDRLYQMLQRLRYEISAREYIAASALFPDGTLREICRKKPKNRRELAEVDGMGIYKANRYGDQILEMIRMFAKPEKEEKSSYRDRVISEGKTEAYQSWSQREDEQLEKEFRAGMNLREIADQHHRTRGAILSRLRKLGLT